MKGMVSKFLKKMLHTVGVGRHSDDEVKNMMAHDMKMLSELLGMFMGGGGGLPVYDIVRMCDLNSPLFQRCQGYDN